jgi:hypothetical protein
MTMAEKPTVEGAPGLIWRPMKDQWEARWQARTDLIEKGFTPKSVRLWKGVTPTQAQAAYIADRCQFYQARMLVFGRGGIPQMQTGAYDGTLGSLIGCYQTDPDSTYGKLRWKTRQSYNGLCARIHADYGSLRVADLRARTVLRWHEAWSEGGKVAMGHSMVAMTRTLFSFGATMLEDGECARMSGVMSKMRFKMPKARTDHVSAEQATVVREAARAHGYFSIALTQALQFELMLRQGDVLGQWIPISEPGISMVHHKGQKWVVGLTWQELDDNMILRHVTSKRQKPIEFDLTLAPMVMEELRYVAQRTAWATSGSKAIMDGTAPMPPLPKTITRADLPATGPIVVCEINALPWRAYEFRRRWRTIARAVGIPDHVKNMDSRSGGATEASAAGAELDDVRIAMTHSQISQTVKYSRGDAGRVATVMKIRAASRNKGGTNGSET